MEPGLLCWRGKCGIVVRNNPAQRELGGNGFVRAYNDAVLWRD